MNTQSLSTLFSFPQSFFKDAEIGKQHHFRDHGQEEGEEHKKLVGKLAEDFYQPSKPQEIGVVDLLRTEMAVQSVASSISHSADIQIRTQEGDVVSISLNQSASSSSAEFHGQQGGSSFSVYSESNSFSFGFSLSIEGNLNDEEQESLAELINKMSKVSDKFFKGNVQGAFKHALKVGFDTEQIAGFSMDLNSRRSVQAVAAYQQTSIPEQNINTDLLKQVGEFLAQTKDFMEDTKILLDSFTEPQQSFVNLFTGVAEMADVAKELPEDELDKSLFLKLIENIADDIFDDVD